MVLQDSRRQFDKDIAFTTVPLLAWAIAHNSSH